MKKHGVSRNSAPQKAGEIEVPVTLAEALGEPPLINGEKLEEYRALHSYFARATQPRNALEWTLLRDVVDLTWEIRRYRRAGDQFIRGGRKDAMASLLQGFYDEGTGIVTPASSHAGTAAAAAMAKNGEAGENGIASILKCYGLTLETVTSQALVLRAGALERLERLIISAERRRAVALREIVWVRQAFGTKLSDAVDAFVDAEVIEETPSPANLNKPQGG